MNSLISIIETALPVFLALFLGMLCRKKGFINRDGIDTLKKVVVNITLPAVLLNAFATAQYSLSTLILPVIVFALCCLALALGFLVTRVCGIQSRLAPFLATGFEAGMLGYALFALLFPQESASKFAIIDLGQTLFVFTLFKILISGKTDWKAIGRDMVTTPILWAVLFGVLLGATGLYSRLHQLNLGGILDASTSFLSAPTGMIILLTVGYDLVLGELNWKKIGGLILMRLGIMAVFLFCLVALNRFVLNNIIFEGAALLFVILPPPYVIPVFADEPGERSQIASALSAMTLLTMLLFALCSVFVNLG